MSSEVSASELSYLKAQVWILQNRLKEEKQNSTNLVVIIQFLNSKFSN